MVKVAEHVVIAQLRHFQIVLGNKDNLARASVLFDIAHSLDVGGIAGAAGALGLRAIDDPTAPMRKVSTDAIAAVLIAAHLELEIRGGRRLDIHREQARIDRDSALGKTFFSGHKHAPLHRATKITPDTRRAHLMARSALRTITIRFQPRPGF